MKTGVTTEAISVSTAGMPAKLSWLQLCRQARDQDLPFFLMPVAYVLWCGKVSWLVPMAISKVGWWHTMRTMLYLTLTTVLMIYEINHIWKRRNDHHSECNLCNCVKKPEKKSIHWDNHFFIFISFPQFIYDLFHISSTLISFMGTYEPTIDLLPTSVAS